MNERDFGVLLIGYGNPGRLDDGLGPALADALAERDIPGVTVEADYQLTVEDAATVAGHDVVVFADADVAGPEPFSFRPIVPQASLGFSSHSVEPPEVLALAQELFGARTRGYVLGIRGYAFNEFGETLSEKARANLASALSFIEAVLRDRALREAEKGGTQVVCSTRLAGRCATDELHLLSDKYRACNGDEQ